MKQNKSKYILMPVVGLIWVLVALRYLGFFDPEEETLVTPTNIRRNIVLTDTLPRGQEFKLDLDFRDPFLDKPAPRSNRNIGRPEHEGTYVPVNNNPPVVKQTEPVKPTETYDWSKIRYSGLVKISSSEKTMGLLRIRGTTHYVEPGKMYEEVEVVRLFADSVRVKVGKEQRSLRR